MTNMKVKDQTCMRREGRELENCIVQREKEWMQTMLVSLIDFWLADSMRNINEHSVVVHSSNSFNPRRITSH